MSLEEAVELVVFAFEHAQAGDIMVQKSPASTIGDLAQGLLELFDADNEIKIIGTRHDLDPPLAGLAGAGYSRPVPGQVLCGL